MEFYFFLDELFYFLLLGASYFGGAQLLITRRRHHPAAKYYDKENIGKLLVLLISGIYLIFIIIIGFRFGLLASIIAFIISIFISNIFAKFKNIIYPLFR